MKKFEKEIALFDIKFNGLKYQLYIYKSFNWVLNPLNSYCIMAVSLK